MSRNKGQMPKQIIIFRDGVSDSQFQSILESELPSIQGTAKHVHSVLCCSVIETVQDTEEYYLILFYTKLYYTILYYTILYYTILYYTILYYTILYYTILYYTILYYSIV